MRAALKQRRVDLGLTRTEVSRRMGRDDSTISKLESSKMGLTVEVLVAWAAALNAQVEVTTPEPTSAMRTQFSRLFRIWQRLDPFQRGRVLGVAETLMKEEGHE